MISPGSGIGTGEQWRHGSKTATIERRNSNIGYRQSLTK
jgi:hypothetical protein